MRDKIVCRAHNDDTERDAIYALFKKLKGREQINKYIDSSPDKADTWYIQNFTSSQRLHRHHKEHSALKHGVWDKCYQITELSTELNYTKHIVFRSTSFTKVFWPQSHVPRYEHPHGIVRSNNNLKFLEPNIMKWNLWSNGILLWYERRIRLTREWRRDKLLYLMETECRYVL